MEKQTYYVSVQAGTVLEDKEAAGYEFEIQATEKEIEQLMELFEYREEAENANFRRAMIPGIPYIRMKKMTFMTQGCVRSIR